MAANRAKIERVQGIGGWMGADGRDEFAVKRCVIIQSSLLLGTVIAGPFCEAGGSFFNIVKEIIGTWNPNYM